MLYNKTEQFNNGRRSIFVVTPPEKGGGRRKAMKYRILAAFLAASVLMCSLCSCGGTTSEPPAAGDEIAPSTQGGTANEITVGIAQDLDDSLDPYQMTAAGTREVMFNVFEGLVKPDSDGNFVCAVASDYSISDDGLTYTFPLREGVVFHNGAACTADDVLYSFEECAATSMTSALVTALSAAQVTAEGDTVVITLTEPNPDFLSYVSSVAIVPRDYTDQATQPVGTGPFKYVSRSVQENVILERNDSYYGTPAGLDRVVFRIFEDPNALFTALNGGALDLAAKLTVDQVNNLTNGYTVLEGTMNLVQAMYLNHAWKPFNDVRVRRALCYAVDVPALLELTAGGHGTPVGSSMYPAFGKYFDPSLADAYPHDVAKARELVTEAGYPDGFSFTITVPSNYPQHMETAQVLAEQLKEAGIQAEVQPVDWDTWVADVYGNRNFEATVVGFDASTLTAGAMLSRWVSNDEKNMISYDNPDYDAAYALAQDPSLSEEEQTEHYMECLRILSDTAANVYIQDLANLVAINPALEGYEFYPLYVMDMSTLHFAA